jgi:TRAP-type C4-dicarboxylate transport system permease small subunit
MTDIWFIKLASLWDDHIKVDVPNQSTADADARVNDVVNFVIGILGVVCVVMIIYGGIQYSSSGGDVAKIEKAKRTILYSVVGLILSALAFAIVNFVIKGLQ